MDTKYKIKNFRVFDKVGVEFDLNPITILTGCNSAGKSSLVKSILLLNDFLSQLKLNLDKEGDYGLEKATLNCNDKQLVLGRYDLVTNQSNPELKDITFNYSVDSVCLGNRVFVEMVFTPNEKDILNNGRLKSITVTDCDNHVLLDASLIFGETNLMPKTIKHKNGRIKINEIDFTYLKKNHLLFSLFLNYFDAIETIGYYKSVGQELDELSDAFSIKEFVEELDADKYSTWMDDIYVNRSYSSSDLKKIKLDTFGNILRKNKCNVINYFPIFDKLVNLGKDEACLFLLDIAKKQRLNPSIITPLNELISDFKESEYSNFVSYFAHIEEMHNIAPFNKSYMRLVQVKQLNKQIESFFTLENYIGLMDFIFYDEEINGGEDTNTEPYKLTYDFILQLMAILSVEFSEEYKEYTSVH